MITIRDYLWLGLMIVAAIGFFWYRSHLIGIGEARCKLEVQNAIVQQQAIANQNAEIYQAQADQNHIEYRTRIKEVVKYVTVNHACDLPPNVVGMLNDAISGKVPATGTPK